MSMNRYKSSATMFDAPPKIETDRGCLAWNDESMGVLSTGKKVRYKREFSLGLCHRPADGLSLQVVETMSLVQSDMDISSIVDLT